MTIDYNDPLKSALLNEIEMLQSVEKMGRIDAKSNVGDWFRRGRRIRSMK